jgi:hypothetical protein
MLPVPEISSYLLFQIVHHIFHHQDSKTRRGKPYFTTKTPRHKEEKHYIFLASSCLRGFPSSPPRLQDTRRTHAQLSFSWWRYGLFISQDHPYNAVFDHGNIEIDDQPEAVAGKLQICQ